MNIGVVDKSLRNKPGMYVLKCCLTNKEIAYDFAKLLHAINEKNKKDEKNDENGGLIGSVPITASDINEMLIEKEEAEYQLMNFLKPLNDIQKTSIACFFHMGRCALCGDFVNGSNNKSDYIDDIKISWDEMLGCVNSGSYGIMYFAFEKDPEIVFNYICIGIDVVRNYASVLKDKFDEKLDRKQILWSDGSDIYLSPLLCKNFR